MNKEKTWKTIAIIFIFLFLIETLFLLTLSKEASYSRWKEKDCYENICGEYDTYSYEVLEDTCYCGSSDGDILFEKYMG